MNRKTLRKQQKAIRRRHTRKLFEAPLLDNIVPTASTPAAPTLSRSQRRLLNQLGELAADISKVFHRASLKLMVEGLKSGRVSIE